MAYPETDVVIIAFNIMARSSFENITETWIKDKNNHMKDAKVGMSCMDKINSGPDGKCSMTKYFQIVLIGTKCDLKEDKEALEEMRRAYGPEARPISKKEGDALARKIKAYAYFETSAKENIGVTEALNAAKAVVEKVDLKRPTCICL